MPDYAANPVENIDLRKRWLSFSEEDEKLIAEIDDILSENIDPLIDDMYAHFLSFPETRRFFPDEATLRRAQTAQKAYFLRLTKGDYDLDYVNERLAVGTTHYRIGLDPKWYLGAYNRVMTWLRRLVQERFQDDIEKYLSVIAALTRLVFFDMSLAIDSYMIAKENAIRKQRDAIKELETERRVVQSMMENAPVGIVQLNPALVCTSCNQEFMQIVDQDSADQVVGKSVRDFAPHLDVSLLLGVLESGSPLRRSADLLYMGSDKTPNYYDWAAWPVRDESGHNTGLVAFFQNATDRVLLQQQREDFVATLTHDLKTPILAANRAVKLLMEGDFGPVHDSQAKILENIHQSNLALYKLVQTLLDVYRYDSGAKKLSISPHDLAETIRNSIEEIRPLTQTKQVELSGDLPSSETTISYDAEEIRRVIQNLLDNSMKFTPKGGKITVRLRLKGSSAEVSVSDTGKGIPDEDKPKLFQRFWAAASSGRYYASTGLGLYLCRKIVELHGGEIWCESEVGKGSTFYFTINPERVPSSALSQGMAEAD